MKHWNRRLGVKIACFVLAIPLLAVLIFGSIGMVYLQQENYYAATREELLAEMNYRVFVSDIDDIFWHGSSTEEGIRFDLPSTYTSTRYTNLRFQILDHQGTVLCTNIPASDVPESFPMVIYWTYYFTDGHYFNFGSVTNEGDLLEEHHYMVQGYIATEMEAQDAYYWGRMFVNFGYDMRYAGFYILGACLILMLFCLVNLTLTAGRKPNSQELHPGRLDKLPTDVLFVGCLCIVGVWYPILEELTWKAGDVFANVLIWLSIVTGCYCLLGLWICLASRFKRKQLLKNTLTYKCCHFLWQGGKTLVTNLPMIWRTGLLAAGLILWNFMMLVFLRSGVGIVMFLVEAVVVTLGMLWTALQLRKLQKAGQALAAGDLHYQVDTTGLAGDFKAHGENLNSIAQGMSKAVSEQVKSQRMKTELITNVSHDIKNPLTSIINYAGLIAQEPCENEKHGEYSAVLARKSEHLKRLLEDLVEMSKATTGNMEMELVQCQAGVLLEQLTGEFSDRCQQAGLTLLVKQPEEPIAIRVDSRRIWRVFENLMGNACKYSLPGSRVYLSLERRGDTAVFTFRNTSRDALDISPEELLERFVRGDSARSTEGNGLGLSIAQSLTQLQGGEMHIGIDGDLFKVTLHFPVV